MIKLGRQSFLPSLRNTLFKCIHPIDCLTQSDPNFDQTLLLGTEGLGTEGSVWLIQKGHFLRNKKLKRAKIT